MKALIALAALAAVFVPIAARAQLCDLNLVAQDESGHRNIPNFRYDAHHTAEGHWQITETNWRHFAPMVDIDLQKWPNALSAPEQLQGQVAGIMKAKLGCLPWVPYNARLRRDIEMRRADYAAPAHTATTAATVAIKSVVRSAWSPEQIARLTASSSVWNPMQISLH